MIVTKSQWNIITVSLYKHAAVLGCKNTSLGLIYTLFKTAVWHALKVKLARWMWCGWGIYVTLWIKAVRTCHPPWWREARWNEVGGVWKRSVPQISPWSFDLLTTNSGKLQERQLRAIACRAVTDLNKNTRWLSPLRYQNVWKMHQSVTE